MEETLSQKIVALVGERISKESGPISEKQRLLDRIKVMIDRDGLKDMHFTFDQSFYKLNEEGRAKAINNVLDAIERQEFSPMEPFGDSKGRRTDVF